MPHVNKGYHDFRAEGRCHHCGSPHRPLHKAGLCETCYQSRREAWKRTNAKQSERRRIAVFDHYGWECSWCGNDDPMHLVIDHIEDDGAEHRRSFGGGSNTYRQLIKEGFPDTVQTLCANCNTAKARGRTKEEAIGIYGKRSS